MDVLRAELVGPGGATAEKALADWLARPGTRDPDYSEIQEALLPLRHRALHSMTLADLRPALEWDFNEFGHPQDHPRHALGRIRASEDREDVADASIPWTFAYMLHELMELLGRVPTWPEFLEKVRGEWRHRWCGRLRGAIIAFHEARRRQAEERGLPAPDPIDVDEPGTNHAIQRAARWRLGCGYYSFLREVDLLTRLRCEHGLPMRYHALADALFRADMWCGPVIVSVNVTNDRYRAGDGRGRKALPQRNLGSTAFSFVRVEIGNRPAPGRPGLVAPAQIAALARQIREALDERCSPSA